MTSKLHRNTLGLIFRILVIFTLIKRNSNILSRFYHNSAGFAKRKAHPEKPSFYPLTLLWVFQKVMYFQTCFVLLMKFSLVLINLDTLTPIYFNYKYVYISKKNYVIYEVFHSLTEKTGQPTSSSLSDINDSGPRCCGSRASPVRNA